MATEGILQCSGHVLSPSTAASFSPSLKTMTTASPTVPALAPFIAAILFRFQSAFHFYQQLIDVKWFQKIIVRTHAHGLDHRIEFGTTGNDNDRC